jgi:uncharacterized protein YjlB
LKSNKADPMSIVEDLKEYAERASGWQRPSAAQLAELPQRRTPLVLRFRDDGRIPNNPYWPLLVFRAAVKLPRQFDPAAVFEDIFESNGWGDTWRGEIYDYLHYHSRIHEVLGIARGSAKVRLGGNKGRVLTLKAGDVVVIPAGTGHQALSMSKSFMAVGAYPPSGTYDECGPTAEEHVRGVRTVRKVGRPRRDPVFGSKGPLLKAWKARR